MLKFNPLIAVLMFSVTSVFAQTTITNGNMSTWLNTGQATEHPQQWSQIKNGGGGCGICITFAPQGAFRESGTYNSSPYSAKVVTGTAFGNVANGTLTTGQLMVPSTDKNEGYIHSRRNDPNYAMPFTGRPDSLVFYYKATPAGADYPGMNVYLHVGNYYVPEAPYNSNHPDSSINQIASGFWTGTAGGTVSSWTRVSIPLTYVDSRTPEYIFLIATSSADQNGGTDGSLFWIDDVSVVYNPTLAAGTINPLLYYVSASQGASISIPYTITGTFTGGNTFTAQLSNASGSFTSPVTIGSVTSTSSGAISGTIPAGTATGTGYRVRVVSSNPALTSASNTSDISITLVGNSAAPSTMQTIAANTNGTALNVAETPAATSREWKYGTASGGPYSSFGTAQTGTAYTPNFATAGDYYVVCVSTFGALNVTSNEVHIQVVSNSIAPPSPQSILVGVNGTMLTVTETPSGTSREWKYGTASGGPYSAFGTMQMNTTYTPNFLASGNYFVVCESIISGVTVRSNEVPVSVNNVTLTTGTVNGSPFYFSPSAPDINVSVPYTTSGTFNGGNVFTAQLSDAAGSFASATNIGTLAATSSGTITATIPHTTPTGAGYRVRVISSNPAVNGTDNGVDLIVDQFSNYITPSTTQTIMFNTNGTLITVAESQAGTREWRWSTTSGSGYQSFTTPEVGNAYTPNFPLPGTYYVVCVSNNLYDDVTSNEVQIDVQNGSTITTSAYTGTNPVLISASANVNISVDFTSNAVFGVNNVFTAELSDANGSFASPTGIGTLNGNTIGTISGHIPNLLAAGTHYRYRVTSTTPPITGSDNGADITITPFEISVAPNTAQTLLTNQSGTTLTVTESQSSTREWKKSDVMGSGYQSFIPVEINTTYTPQFAIAGTYFVVCRSVNSLSDAIISQDVTIIVNEPSGIETTNNSFAAVYFSGNDLVIDLNSSKMISPSVEITNVIGQTVLNSKLNPSSVNRVSTKLIEGVYVFKITDGSNVYTGKVLKK